MHQSRKPPARTTRPTGPNPEESCASFAVLQAFASIQRTFWESFQEWFSWCQKCFVFAGFTFLQNLRFFQSFWSHLVEHCLRASILYQAGSQQPFRLTTCIWGKQGPKLEAIGAGNWSKNWLCSMSDRNYNEVDVSMSVNIQAKDSHP